MKSPQEVELRQVIKVEGVQDAYLADLAKVYRTLSRRLTEYLKDIENNPTGAVDTAKAMQDIQKVLTDSGIYRTGQDLLNDGSRAALDAAQETYSQLYSAELQYQQQAKAMLDAVRQSTMANFQSIGSDVATKLGRVVTDLSFGVSSYAAAADQVQKVLDLSAAQAETWARTTMASVHRTATVALGEQIGIDKYMYWGPDDKLTRDFCNEHIGEVRTMKEWAALPNGQIGTAATMGGGYNCRHRLIPVGQAEPDMVD